MTPAPLPPCPPAPLPVPERQALSNLELGDNSREKEARVVRPTSLAPDSSGHSR
ncbi:MAG: hypothetical protein ACK587_01505 [Cyanobacteriota bacterium]